MSIRIPLNELTEGQRNIILKQLCFEKKSNTMFNAPAQQVYPYEIVDEGNDVFAIYLPMYWAMKYISVSKKYLPSRKNFKENNTKFTGSLRPLQEEVQKSAVELLNRQKACIISLYTGAGKTITSIYISTKIKLPTLILVHRLVLMDQWKESIERVCENPKIQIIKTSSMLDKDADYYLMNISNVKKKSRDLIIKTAKGNNVFSYRYANELGNPETLQGTNNTYWISYYKDLDITLISLKKNDKILNATSGKNQYITID